MYYNWHYNVVYCRYSTTKEEGIKLFSVLPLESGSHDLFAQAPKPAAAAGSNKDENNFNAGDVFFFYKIRAIINKHVVSDFSTNFGAPKNNGGGFETFLDEMASAAKQQPQQQQLAGSSSNPWTTNSKNPFL